MLLPLFFSLGMTARRKRPDHHKRYMLLLTFLMVEAALSRIDYIPGMGSQDTFYWVQYLYLDTILLALVLYDWRTLGRPHPATLIGGGIIIAYQLTAVTLWDSELWLGTVDRIEAFLAARV